MTVPEGYIISPIPPEEYDPKGDLDLSQFRQIFPHREGPRPQTTRHEPHQQIDQHADPTIWEELHRRCFSMPGVVEHESLISVPGARALWLDEGVTQGPAHAFIIEREFAHIHPKPDASMHLKLPLELAVLAIGAGWGEPHTVVWLGLAPPTTVMLFAPRTEEELEVIFGLVEESYRFARGEPARLVIEPQLVESGAPHETDDADGT
jgi:hypothetical protein